MVSPIGRLGPNAAMVVVSGLYGHARDTAPTRHLPTVGWTVMARDFSWLCAKLLRVATDSHPLLYRVMVRV